MSALVRSSVIAHLRVCALAFLTAVALVPAAMLTAQDTRTVLEPSFPTTCTTLVAQQATVSGEPTSETTLDTTAIQTALNACPVGQAVELTTSGASNAFLIAPIMIPTGVTLVVDGGVTVYGSRNPADYQSTVTGAETCGTVGTAGNGCNPLIAVAGTSGTHSAGAGVMGYGIINGRGGDKLLVNGVSGASSWWDLANQANAAAGAQNNPILLYARYADNVTLYKISLLNSAMFHVKYQYGTGFTVWGVKIVAPYNARNTDGIDPTDKINNVTITNSYISSGDDNIALGATGAGNPVTNVTIQNLHTYAGHGVSIGSYTSGGVSNVYVNNVNQSGNLADTNSAGLKIKSAQDRGGLVNNVSYNNVCMQYIRFPLQFNPTYNANTGTLPPSYQNIGLHQVTVAAIGNSQVQINGLNANFPLGIQLDDLNITGGFSLNPSARFSNIQVGPGPVNPTGLQTLGGTVTYSGVITNPSEAAHACPATNYPFLAGELYLSTTTTSNSKTLTLPDPATFKLNAVVETVESSSVTPSSAIQFFEVGKLVGTAALSGNGTIASLQFSGITAGSHTYTAVYPADTNYAATTLGSVTVNVATTATTTTLVASPTSTQYGNSVALTATVKQTVGNIVPTGTVTYRIGSTTLGTATLAAGVATLNATTIPVGNNAIISFYGGDTQSSTSDSSASPTNVAIAQAGTTAAIKSSVASTVYGAVETLTATITPATSGAPTGSVTFMDGSTILGTGTLSSKAPYVATFTSSTIPTGLHNITAVFGGDTNFTGSTSALTQVTIFTASTATSIGFLQGTAPFGTSITMAAGITSNSSSAPTATGTITFYEGTTALSTVTITSSASGATYSTATLSVGTHSLYAVYSGDTNYTGSTSTSNPIVITKATVTATLGAQSTTISYGTSEVLTATISPSTSGTPTGTVTFFDGSMSLGSQLLSASVATLTVPTLTGGSHNLSVVYSGDASFATATSSTLSITVTTAATTTVVTVPASITYGNAAPLSATVSSSVAGTQTGPVTFSDGTTVLGTATLSAGVATYSAAGLTGGTHNITASYAGDTNFATSASISVPLTVNKATPTAAIGANPTSITYGASTLLTATLTPTTATGTFTFQDGNVTLGTGTIANGAATYTASSLTAGPHTLSAVYSGDGNYVKASTSGVSVAVAQATTATALVANPSTISYLQSTVLTATLPAAATGTVTFFDGSTSIGSGAIANGVATTTAASLSGGAHSITAVFAGDANFTGSTSAVVNLMVSPAASSTTVSANPSTVSFGGATVLTATLANTTGTGSVTFLDGSAVLGTGTISSGVATFTAAGLTGGSHSITASYSGDSNFAASISLVFKVTVTLAATTTTVIASASTITFGQSTLLTATLSNSAATGTVIFRDGSTVVGTGTVSAGSVSVTVSGLLAGPHSISATYSGDNNFATSLSGSLSLTVNTLATSTSVVATPSSATYGTPVTLTATIAPNGGSPGETGLVTFTDGATIVGQGAVSGGVATLIVPSFSVGGHSIAAAYAGDSNYTASGSSTVAVTVLQVTSTVSLAANPSSIIYGGMTKLTSTVAPPTATGTITFRDSVAGILGTGTINGGVATLSVSTLTGGTHSITATYGGDTNDAAAMSSATTVQVALVTTGTTLVAVPTSTNYGASTMLTAGVTPTAATGTVTFNDGAVVLGTSNLAGGTATLTVTTLSVGSHSITATYSGDINDATSTSAATAVTVSLAPTSASIAATPSPAQFGSATNVAVTISAATSTGTVTIKDGTKTIGTATVTGGVAIFSTTLTTGTHLLSANYSGDANFAASTTTASATVVINVATSTIVASVSPASTSLGSAVRLAAVVTPAAATGTVTFTDTSTGLVVGTAAVSGGSASLLGVLLSPAGLHPIVVTYSGDVNDGGSIATAVAVNIAAGPTTVTLSNTPANQVTYGTKVALTTVMSSLLGVAPTGTMQYLDGTTLLGSATVTLDATNSPVSSFSIATLMPGTHVLTAVYSGDGDYGTTTSSAVSLVVSNANSTIALVSSPPQTVPGQSFTLTATVASSNGSGTPTGTVTFFDQSNNSLGTVVLVGGSASVTQSQTVLGNYSYISTYSGDVDFNPVSSAASPTVVGVKQLGSSTMLVASPTSGTFGTGTYGLTATVMPLSGGPATGTVTFTDGATVLGTVALTSSDSASLANLSLVGGVHNVAAIYNGDVVYTSSVSSAVPITVNTAATTTSVSISPATSNFGTGVTFSAAVTNTTGTSATGNVMFMSGSMVIGTSPVNASGIASFSTSLLPIAMYNVVAVYGGDLNFTTSSSAATAVTVTQIPQTITESTIPTAAIYGVAPITITASASSGLAVTLSVSGPATLSGSTVNIMGFGTVVVTASQPGNTTSAPAKSIVTTMTVAKAPLTVTQQSLTIAYGSSIPTLTGTLAGVVNNDNITANYATTATASSGPGTYPVTATLADPGNKLVNYAVTNPGATLTVSANTQTITFPPISNAVTYGTSPVTLTATAKSNLAVIYTVTGPATVSGSTLTYTGFGTVVVTATQPGNSIYSAAVSIAQTVTVAKSPLTVVVNAQSIIAGAAIPTLTGTLTGVVNGDAITATYATIATETSGPGTYPITVTLVDPNNRLVNYSVTNTSASLQISINAQTITFAAIPTAVTYGATPVTLMATVNSTLPITYTVTGPAAVSGTMLTYTGAGTVVVTAMQAGNTNYAAATPVSQSITVTRAALSVTGASLTRAYGLANPTLTGTLTGVVNGDSITASYTTTATTASVVGAYPITPTLVDPNNRLGNYAVTNTAGTVTVTSGTTAIALSLSSSSIYASVPVTLTATVTSTSGAPTSGIVTFLNGTLTLGTGSVNTSGVATLTLNNLIAATYAVTANFAAVGNYSGATSSAQALTVSLAPTTTTLTLSAASIYANGSLTLTATVASPAGAPASGTVTFLNGTATLGTATVTGGGVATLVVNNLAAGSYSFTASYPVGAVYAGSTSSAATLTVVSPVALALSPTSLALAPGGAGSSTLTLSPGAGFTGTVTLVCSSPVTYIVCTVTSPITISGTTAGTATVSITVAATYGMLSAPPVGPKMGPSAAVYAVLMPFGALLMLPLIRRRRALFSNRGLRLLVLLIMAAGVSMAVTGCGGGSTVTASKPPVGATTVTITATAANAATTTTLTVNVTN